MFKTFNYTDGTPSREVDDWEASGAEEMNKLLEECQHNRSTIEAEEKQKASILEVRDRLNNMIDLITLCHDSLECSQLFAIKQHVSHVLYFYVREQIKLAEKELANL